MINFLFIKEKDYIINNSYYWRIEVGQPTLVAINKEDIAEFLRLEIKNKKWFGLRSKWMYGHSK